MGRWTSREQGSSQAIQHVVQQLVMQGVQITEKADWREGFEQFGDFIASDYASKPNGAPATA